MDNLELYNNVRNVPQEAKKEIKGGRLKGMTDINPMWRIKTLTEQFGICGMGWKTEIVNKWLDEGANGEIIANVEIKLYVKVQEQWSDGIPGIGGSKFTSKESNSIYTDDECYKKAYTDACSVACKNLGIGADVYFEKDSTKYDEKPNTEQPGSKGTKSKFTQISELIKDTELTMDNVKEWIIKYYKEDIRINDLTDTQFNSLVKALKKYIAEQPNE